jgi:hypothetical protein
MKERIRQISQTLYRGIRWGLRHRWHSIAIVSLLIFLGVLIQFIVTPRLSATELQDSTDTGEASPVIEAYEMVDNLGLPLDEFLVHEDESGMQLYFNPGNANVRIYDPVLNTNWNSAYNSTRDFDKLEAYEITAMSMLNITYFGYDNSSAKWNVFEQSVMHGNYTANKIEDGLQLVFDVRDLNSVNLFEFIPQEISSERYHSIFMDGIENADIPLSDRVNLQSTFDFCYRYREDTDSYYYRLASTPQLAMIEYLIYATELFEYTQEDVVNDNLEFGIETLFVERPSFMVTMEFKLDDGDFIVTVPTAAIENGSDKFDIINIEVLPNFGGADYRYTNGFTFVPDGNGAIMYLDSYQDAYPRYSKPVYDNNMYFDIYNENEYSENIEMPVFGMTYQAGLARPMQGYFGIIETGAEFAYIQSQVSDGYSMNQAFSSFDTIQDAYLKVFGPYAIQTNLFRSETPFSNVTYTVRYKLFGEDQSSYYEMSKMYQDYLIEEYDLERQASDTQIHLDVLGAVLVQDRIMGLPYESVRAYTTTSELQSILSDINANTSVNYLGAVNRGVKNDMMNRVEPMRQLEDGITLEELVDSVSDLYLGVNMTRAYNDENGMRNRYAMHDFYGEPLDITQYNIATGQFEDEIVTNDYQIISPRYFPSLVNQYLDESGWIPNVALLDMGNTYYVDYNRNHYISGMDAMTIMRQEMEKIYTEQQIMVPNPFIEFIPYLNLATGISRESSNYGGFSHTVPFKQLVLYGLVPFTTEPINYGTAKADAYYLLQYAEFHAIPSFFVSYQATTDLMETEYNYYYSIRYEYHKDAINQAVTYLSTVDSVKTSSTIVDHSILAENIYQITYDDLSVMIVNYNDFEVTVTLPDDSTTTIGAYGYWLE